MSGKPAARQTDPVSCPLPGHGTNPIVTGSPDVLFNHLPAARLGDAAACGQVISGAFSSTVLINGKPASTLGSTTNHGGVIVGGSGDIIIGDSIVSAPFSAPISLPTAKAQAPTVSIRGIEVPISAMASHFAAPAKAARPLTPLLPTSPTSPPPLAAAAQTLASFENDKNRQSRVFNDQAYPMGTPGDPFEKSKVVEQLRVRVARAHGQYVSTQERIAPYPNQQEASLCGPAAFFYALLMDRPDLYTQAIVDLWETGETTIGQLHIKPSHDCRNPKNFSDTSAGDRISAIDWISLASLRDSENAFFDYDSPSDQVPGITLPGKVESWFTKSGATVVFDNIQFRGHINLKQFMELLSYQGPQYHVTSLVCAMMVDGGVGLGKNHWIVWEGTPETQAGAITPTTDLEEEITNSSFFSWGYVAHQTRRGYSLKQLLKDIFGGIVFSRIP